MIKKQQIMAKYSVLGVQSILQSPAQCSTKRQDSDRLLYLLCDETKLKWSLVYK